MVESEDTVTIDDDAKSSVSCSICLDFVIDQGDRSTAKLQCGHQFHLDCIGSAFNMKGAMQCPNCRKIEKGRWLYANGSTRSLPEFGIDDWTPNEDSYEFSYSEMPFGVHWCPFSGLTRVHSSFEELESPSTTYHDLQGNHAIFAEHTAASSLAHSYVAYLQPLPPVSSNSSENLDDPNFSHRWNGLFRHNEIYTPHPFPGNSIQYQGWGRHSPPFSANRSHMNNANQASVPSATLRSTRAESDSLSRSGSTVHPFLHGHGSVPRGGLPFVSSVVHPSTNPRSHERIHISHASHRQQQPSNPTGMPLSIIPNVRRFVGQRGPPLPAVSQSDRSEGFYIFPPSGSSGRTPREAENHLLNHVHQREHPSRFPFISFDRDSVWGTTDLSTGGSNSINRSGSFWQRHWS